MRYITAGLLALILVVSGIVFAFANSMLLVGGGGGLGISAHMAPSQAIASIAPTSMSYTAGSGSGTVVGTAVATMSPSSPTFSGGWSLVSPGDTTHFAIGASTGVVTLTSTDPCSPGPCTIDVKATPSNPLIASLTQAVTVTSISSGGTFAPSIATTFDDEPAGASVTALWAGAPVPGSTSHVQTLSSCSASGWSAVQCSVYQYIGDTATAPWLQTTRALTSGDLGQHTVSVSGGGYSGTVTINVVQPQPTTPPSYVGQTAQGYIGANVVDSLVYTGEFGGPCGSAGAVNPGFPVVMAFDIVDQTGLGSCNMPDYHQAALGNYTATWKASVAGWNAAITGGLVGIRVNSEWQGNGAGPNSCATNYVSSPYTNNPGCSYPGAVEGGGTYTSNGSGLVSPSDYVQAVQNFADMVHANFPNIRVTFQSACDNSSDLPYWPTSLASHIDSAGEDLYFQPKYDGTNSVVEWQTMTTPQSWQSSATSNNHGGCNPATATMFAASRGMTVSHDEFCDGYPDGYNLTRYFFSEGPQYLERLTYWNNNDNIDPDYPCQLDGSGDINSGASTAYHDMLGTGAGTYVYNGPWTNY